MRYFPILLTFVLLSGTAYGQTYPYTEAASHAGQNVTIEGPVSEVFTSRRGDTFIDIGGRYPNQQFSGVVFVDDANIVGNVHGLEGKTVDLTGRIRMYRGKPEIVIHSAGQISAR
jgi:exonuclease VII large subunit